MSDSTIGQIDPYDGMDLGAYRYAVARLLRLLIRARLTQESEFLSEDDRQRWQEKLIEPDSQTIESLLHEVCRANDFLYNQVLGPGNSVGIVPGDSRDQLKENVISVMTSLWSVLDEWIVNATKGEQIKWDDVIPIDSVRLIRDGLDAQGQRTLNSFSGKDLRQEVVAPAATASFHGDAFRCRMLFQER